LTSTQIEVKKQGPVLYYALSVFDAISDLANIESDKGGSAVYGPSLSVLQTKVSQGLLLLPCTAIIINSALGPTFFTKFVIKIDTL
jgi:hypothetical protein